MKEGQTKVIVKGDGFLGDGFQHPEEVRVISFDLIERSLEKVFQINRQLFLHLVVILLESLPHSSHPKGQFAFFLLFVLLLLCDADLGQVLSSSSRSEKAIEQFEAYISYDLKWGIICRNTSPTPFTLGHLVFCFIVSPRCQSLILEEEEEEEEDLKRKT